MRASTSFATDRKLPFPVLVEYSCAWEPDDSAIGPGILYLAAEVVGEPKYVEFGPSTDGDGDTVEKAWAHQLKDVWGNMQEHYSDTTFTDERQVELEEFFKAFPWGGLKDVPEQYRPPFRLPVFGESRTEAALDPDAQRVLDSVGLDTEGSMRIGFACGKDTLEYPLAMSRPAFGKAGTFLDGTTRVARQRKRKGAKLVNDIT